MAPLMQMFLPRKIPDGLMPHMPANFQMEQLGGMMSVIAALIMGWIGLILRQVLGGGSKGLSDAGGTGGVNAGNGGRVGDVPARGQWCTE